MPQSLHKPLYVFALSIGYGMEAKNDPHQTKMGSALQMLKCGICQPMLKVFRDRPGVVSCVIFGLEEQRELRQ